MKKVVSALTAAAMCASMAAGVMSAIAYEAGDVNLSLEVISTGSYTVDGSTITFASAEDAKNASFTVAQFVNCDATTPDITQVGARIVASDAAITLTKDKLADPTNATHYAEAQTYTVNDVEFSTTNYVCCFSYLNKLKKFKNGTAAFVSSETEIDGADSVAWIWQYSFDANVYDNYKETAHFFGATSDEFPLTEIEVSLGDIAEGTYTIDFLETYDTGVAGMSTNATFFTGNDGVTKVPSTTGLTIVVGDAGEEPTTEPTTTEPEVTEPTDDNPSGSDEFTWDIEDVAGVAPGDMVPVHVFVNNDKGCAGYNVKILVDGKEVGESALVSALDIMKGDDAGTSTSYSELEVFVPNAEKLAIGAASNVIKENVYAKDGEAIFVMYFEIPADAADGTVYELTWDTLSPMDIDQNATNPKGLAGSITVGDPLPTDTDEPTEEPTTTPEPTDTTAPTETDPADTDPTQPGDYLYGDVNKNGVVELVDIVMLNRNLTGYGDQALDDYQTEVADCWDDGALDGKDSMEILRYLIGLVTSLPTAV